MSLLAPVMLLVPWAFGMLIVHRLLQENNRLQVAASGWILGFLALTLGANSMLLAGQSLTGSVWMTTVILGVLAGLLWLRQGPPMECPPWGGGAWLFFSLGLGLTYLYAVAAQNVLPDDDYFIHAPLQGQFRKGTYPLVNPFFPDLAYGGHYARNLLIAAMNVFHGGELVVTQMWSTVALQLVGFVVLLVTLYQATDSEVQATLGTTFVFLGGNAGARGGWLDSIDNNNPLAQALVALSLYLFLRLWREPRIATALTTAFVLAGFAWVYETHFGLVVLAALSTLLLLKALGATVVPRALVFTLLALALAGPLGVTQGGTLGHLYQRLVKGGQELSEIQDSEALVRQNQKVSMHFPKEQFFQVLFTWGPKASISRPYLILPGLRDLDYQIGEPGYAYIWSWRALRVHWLALLLAPLSLFLLLRARHTAGLFLWNFGMIAYLVPAVVDFGVWENEQYRWQFAAAWALAGGLGLALGERFDRFRKAHPEPLWSARLEQGRFLLRANPAGLALIGLLLLTWLNSVSSLDHLGNRIGSLTRLRQALAPLSFDDWVRGQTNFNFLAADYRVGRWLHQNTGTGDRLLTNNKDESNRNIYYDSTLMTLAGLPLAGRALPQVHGEWPYRINPAARAFWQSLDPSLLDDVHADWIVLRELEGQEPAVAKTLSEVPGVELVHTEPDAAGARRWVFHNTRPRPPTYQVEEGSAPLDLASLEFPESLQIQSYHAVEVQLRALKAISGNCRLYYELTRTSDELSVTDPLERIHSPADLHLEAGEQSPVSLHFVSPLQEGRYRMRLFWVASGSSRPIGEPDTEFEVDFRERLLGLELAELTPVDPLEAGRLIRFRVKLKNASTRKLSTGRPLRMAVLARPDGSQDYPTMGERSLAEVSLELPPGGSQELELAALTPLKPVPYRFDLLLAPVDGRQVFRGPALIVDKPFTR